MDGFYKHSFQPDKKIRLPNGKTFWVSKNHVVPERLYKYKPINEYTLMLIQGNEIYHNGVNSFNDPFDGINGFHLEFKETDIIDFVNSVFKKGSNEEIEDTIKFYIGDPIKFQEIIEHYFQEIIKNYGISCFTKKYDNLLMWAHYSENHSGLCLEFNFLDEINDFNDKKIKLEEFNIPHLRKVNYTNSNVEINYKQFVQESFTPVYTKTKVWEYEEEFRSIRPKVGLYPFSKKCLKSIFFGLNCVDEDIQRVIKLVTKCDYHDVNFYKMEKKKNSNQLLKLKL